MNWMNRKALALMALGVAAVLAFVVLRSMWLETEPPVTAPLPSPRVPPVVGSGGAGPAEEGAHGLLQGVEGIDAPAVRSTVAPASCGHRLRGRVIEGTSGRAIAGFRIEVEGTSLETESDAEGRFFLDLEGDEDVTLRVRPASGWAVQVDRHVISTEFLRQGDELFLRALRVARGAWSFVLVDEATDEPVPHFALLAEAQDQTTAELVSDEEGVVAVGERLAGRRPLR